MKNEKINNQVAKEVRTKCINYFRSHLNETHRLIIKFNDKQTEEQIEQWTIALKDTKNVFFGITEDAIYAHSWGSLTYWLDYEYSIDDKEYNKAKNGRPYVYTSRKCTDDKDFH